MNILWDGLIQLFASAFYDTNVTGLTRELLQLPGMTFNVSRYSYIVLTCISVVAQGFANLRLIGGAATRSPAKGNELPAGGDGKTVSH